MPEFLDRIVENLNHSSGVALVIDDQKIHYSELKEMVQCRIESLKEIENQPIGIIADSCAETYASILACWITGNHYIPIPRNYPAVRVQDIKETAEIQHIFCEGEFPAPFNELDFKLLIPQKSSTSQIQTAKVGGEIAYILFTSGTTGKPKGVPISYSNLQAFFEGFMDLGYSLSAEDRFLQMFELTFDLSVMSFMIPLSLGASFYPLKQNLIKPLALYDALENYEISFALMVPSAVTMLEPYAEDIDLQNLKYTQFCGEALKLQTVELWQTCAPKSQIDNVYGPTEATIYCTRYICVPQNSKHHQGIVCIGKAMKHVTLSIENEELCLGGHQTTIGYVKATEVQKERFFTSEGIRYYRSGDKALVDGDDFYCQGRLDDQVKIQGYRVELAEIEYAVSQHFSSIKSIAVAYQTSDGNQLGLYIQDANNETNIDMIAEKLKHQLPFYMIPRVIRIVDDFPLNSNGKIDRKLLSTWLVQS